MDWIGPEQCARARTRNNNEEWLCEQGKGNESMMFGAQQTHDAPAASRFCLPE